MHTQNRAFTLTLHNANIIKARTQAVKCRGTTRGTTRGTMLQGLMYDVRDRDKHNYWEPTDHAAAK